MFNVNDEVYEFMEYAQSVNGHKCLYHGFWTDGALESKQTTRQNSLLIINKYNYCSRVCKSTAKVKNQQSKKCQHQLSLSKVASGKR